MKRLTVVLVALLIVLGLFACVVESYPTMPPPAPRQEIRHYHPGPGYVWIEGHWEWRRGNWFWRQGYWARTRRHRTWVPGHWENRGHRWVWIEGRWR